MDSLPDVTSPITQDKPLLLGVLGVVSMLLAKFVGVTISPDTLAQVVGAIISVYTIVEKAHSAHVSAANASAVSSVETAKVTRALPNPVPGGPTHIVEPAPKPAS
jgi:hypothetical protein